MRSIAVSALLLATSAAADPGDDAVAQARAELQQRLQSASDSGVVTIRGRTEVVPLAQPAPSGLAAATAPALRSFDRSDCLTIEGLLEAEAQLQNDPAGGLELLRRALLDESSAFRERRDIDLARGYLALGFAEEARAIATAQAGVDAAGIAGFGFLVEGNAKAALASVAGFHSCGGLYAFIRDLGSFLDGELKRLPDSAAATLEALPAKMTAPLSEAVALAAIAQDTDAPALIDAALRHGNSAGQSDAGVLLRVLKEDDAAATRRLASMAGAPGPLRQVALGELGKRIDASTPPEIVTGFGLDLEDAAAASGKSQHSWALGLQLAERRLSTGNIDGGVKALGAAFRNPSTRNAAIGRFRALEKSISASARADQQLQRLAVVFAEPELSAASLKAKDLAASANFAAELGAADALTRLKSVPTAPEAAIDLALGEALWRSGRGEEAGEIARENSSDPRFSKLALHLALASGDKNAELAAAKKLGPDEISAVLWRQGDFEALLDLDTQERPGAETATRIALAAVALKRATPPRTLKGADEADAIQSLFADASRVNLSDLKALRRFSESTATATSFFKARMSDE